ncbi:MAG: hypothetical protein Q9214_007297, partial [Letrouitia sp. 1 TL-2023]
MPNYRRALILAVFILTALYLLSGPRSPPPIASQRRPTNTPKSDGDAAPYPMSTGRPNGPPKQETRLYPPPRQRGDKTSSSQQPITQPLPKSLREQLQYQFPYDLEGKFPAYIWQTWKYTPASGEFTDNFRAAEASWTEKHPGFVHEVLTDQAAVYLMRHLYASVPDVLEAYNSLPVPVLKADFFRYLILLARGGIYTDIDTTALVSTTDWIPEEVPRSTIGLIVGIEADPNRTDWREWYSRRIQFCQWTIQAKPGHPVLRDIVVTITEDIL